jgi:8-oxo-dGTP pyrophosphatase MutT (NUDIX family)
MPDWHFSLQSLPPGFLATLENPPDPPAHPCPASTLVLLRSGVKGGKVEGTGLEVLLMKRSPRAGFIPGAWVFPGGIVDDGDGDPDLLPRLHGLSSQRASLRLGPVGTGPPAVAFWVAALRETFEETGVLLLAERGESGASPGPGRREDGDSIHSARAPAPRESIGSARSRLLGGEASFLEILDTLDLALDAGGLVYAGHWLTPECEPRRYETRFFFAQVAGEMRVTPYQREMVDAIWITPEEALAMNRNGTLPLVLPTVFTLEELSGFDTPGEAMDHFRNLPVPRRLPVPERVEDGIVFRLPE